VSNITVLEGIELIPVLKFEPFRFAAEGRSCPTGYYSPPAQQATKKMAAGSLAGGQET
jgi:hypothetical protein